MSFVFANRASVLVTATVQPTDISVQVETGGGGVFPNIPPGSFCPAALIASTGDSEFVYITAFTGDIATVQRAKEGTAALSFAVGSRLENRLTAGTLDDFLQKSGGTMRGDIDMGGHAIANAAPQFAATFTEMHATYLRPLDIPPGTPYSGNEPSTIILQNGGAVALLNSHPILHAGFFNGNFGGVVFDCFFDINNFPTHFKLCDGTNFTPDLRGRFILGANPFGGLPVGSNGGTYEYTTDPGGAFGDALTQPTILNSSNLPDIAVTQTPASVQGATAATQVVRSPVGVGFNDATGRGHEHVVSGKAPHTHTFRVAPPYFALIKAMLNF